MQILGKNTLIGNPIRVDILDNCVVVMNELLKNNVKYSVDVENHLTTNDIKEASDFSKHRCCCATYVSVVLYKSGALSEEFINEYNYNYTGSEGDKSVVDMLDDAGWERITEEEVEPGDVCLYSPVNGKVGHVVIYAGGNEIWDQKSGCISSSDAPPLKGTSSEWDELKRNHELKIWRVPIKVEEIKDVKELNK